MTSRELLSLRENGNNESYKDFYVVGSMGHTSQIALGISINNTKQIICLDGDGAALMHLGSLAMIGSLKKKLTFYTYYLIIFAMNPLVVNQHVPQELVSQKLQKPVVMT